MKQIDYGAMPGINNSSLNYFERSPAHYLYYKTHGDETETVATVTGSAYHLMCWEPENFESKMFVLHEEQRPEPTKDYRNTANKAWKNAIVEKTEKMGRTLISSDEYGIVCDMLTQLARDPQAWELICACRELGKVEFGDTWEKDGILYKRKVDGWHEDFNCDLKSARDADPDEFVRTIFNMKYDRQGGMYNDADRVHQDTAFFKPFFIIAQEKEPPFGVSVHELSVPVLERGAERYHELGKQIQACEKAGKWPGYASKYNGSTNIVNLPAWAQK